MWISGPRGPVPVEGVFQGKNECFRFLGTENTDFHVVESILCLKNPNFYVFYSVLVLSGLARASGQAFWRSQCSPQGVFAWKINVFGVLRVKKGHFSRVL